MNMKLKFCMVIAMFCIAAHITPTHAEDLGQIVAGEEDTEQYVQDAFSAASDGTEVRFKFDPREVYTIYCQDGFVTDIRLSPGEKVTYVGAGDTTRWIVDRSASGVAPERIEHIYIKPVKRGLSTNVIINTSRRTYQLHAISGSYYNPMVSWLVPGEDRRSLFLKNLEERKEDNFLAVNAEQLYFDYKISTDRYTWSPVAVFDDGRKTYLRTSERFKTGDAPALFLVERGQTVLVNYRLTRGYYVVDRLFQKAKLVAGKNEVIITRR